MSQQRPELDMARDLIRDKEFEKARSLLRRMGNDPTALKWLENLDKVAPEAAKPAAAEGQATAAKTGTPDAWQYAGLEARRSYGIQYKVNGVGKPDWKDQPIYYVLNELGKEGWELVTVETVHEFTTYILKKPGAALLNRKAEVWDQ